MNNLLEPNDYNRKLNEYIMESSGRMYIFEITKLCGYSTLIFIYKDETLLDLYNRVSHHFGCNDIKGLYIDNHLYKDNNTNNNTNNNSNNTNNNNIDHNTDHNNNNCFHKKVEHLIPIPISSLITIRNFVFKNTATEPRNMEPIYPIQYPVVYRIYFDDGHCHCNGGY
jgi:hypothetical protein